MSSVVREIFARHGAPPVAKLLSGHRNLTELLCVFEKNGAGREVVPKRWMTPDHENSYYRIEKVIPDKGFKSGKIMATKFVRGTQVSDKLVSLKGSRDDEWFIRDFKHQSSH
ncbi:hypothetical protein H4R33_003505 [Dimargaris cristalligena]|uniref:Uncharacterized protein n=1 Tax=Dimargaris cristalligena TaxID=215637 RepID=A0A4P9ZVW1_9FUNG|nr:hypothetical protein H4R33_003505 [Dimargaris cristalligena]RKP36790.1 hypothetical protein BJ085DRAFT_31536 [Dimargaris cristalligena]|eukprot:RKP36790.1 hypothetical protein BJ085DRAFT_31536 [Dimargaris cristalligena]